MNKQLLRRYIVVKESLPFSPKIDGDVAEVLHFTYVRIQFVVTAFSIDYRRSLFLFSSVLLFTVYCILLTMYVAHILYHESSFKSDARLKQLIIYKIWIIDGR